MLFDFLTKKFVFREFNLNLRLQFCLVLMMVVTTMTAFADVNSFPVTTVSAASYEKVAVTPSSIVSAFGTKLATTTANATDIDPSTPVVDLPTNLSGTTVQVNGQFAGILFISPEQVNFVIPAGAVQGSATIKITSGDGTESNGTVIVALVQPAIFTFNSDGRGVLAAEVVRVKANGTQTRESLTQLDLITNRFVTKPINLGFVDGERVFLEIYVTGIRGAADDNADGNLNENVRVLVGGQSLTPTYAGRQPFYAGLDQVNVELPLALMRTGKVNLALHARAGTCAPCLSLPGVTSNLVEVEIGTPQGDNPATITGLSTTTGAVGEFLGVLGTGFEDYHAGNVKVGGVRTFARFESRSAIAVKVPYGALSGPVSLNIPTGQLRTSNEVVIKTSISGVVETGSETDQNSSVPLQNIAVRLVGTNIATTTDYAGRFTLHDVPTGDVMIEVDPTTFPLAGTFTKVTLPFNVQADRDNLLPGTIWLTSTGKMEEMVSSSGMTITGLITDRDGNVPVQNVLVRLLATDAAGKNQTTLTDSSGGYIFRNVPKAKYILSATSLHYDGNVLQMSRELDLVPLQPNGVPDSPIKADLSFKDAPANRTPTLIAPKSATMNLGETLDLPFYASDPDGDAFTISATGPSSVLIIPSTMGAHVVRVKPASGGAFNVTITIKDTHGVQVSQAIPLTVFALNTAPTVTVPGAQSVKVGQSLTFNVSATDPDAGQTITLTATNMPQGASFTPASPVGSLTGTFSWTPTANQVGTFTVNFTAIDNATPPLSDAKSVTITVTQ